MSDKNNDLEMLNNLVKLEGMPLEKKGLEAKERIEADISEYLLKRTQSINGPYILIEGDRREAIRLATYVYLKKSSIYSDVIIPKHHITPLRKTKKNERLYFEMFHYRPRKISSANRSESTGKIRPKMKIKKPVPITYCMYINHKSGLYSNHSINFDNKGVVFNDFYQSKEDNFNIGKKEQAKRIIYKNHFRYVTWKNSSPKKLLELELMDRKSITGMTMLDMLKFKNTVFLIDFMKGMQEGEEYKELRNIIQELEELKSKNVPGHLLVHVDMKERFPDYFHDLFEKIPINETKSKKTKRKAKLTDKEFMDAFNKAKLDLGKDAKKSMYFNRTFEIIELVHGKGTYASSKVIKKKYYQISKKNKRR